MRRSGSGARDRERALAFWGVFLLFSICSSGELQAQPAPSVQGRRDLTFEIVFPGVPKQVSRMDASNSGMYRVQGRRNTEVSLTFTLPPNLLSASGQTLPVDFAAGDAGFSQDADQSASVGFDPNVPFVVRLSPDGTAWVWLGGTARPGPAQAADFYESGVVLAAAYTGN